MVGLTSSRQTIRDKVFLQELDNQRVSVEMPANHWLLLQRLEKAYRIALAINRGKKQCEKASPMSVNAAFAYIDSL
ncbi:MAG: hypothetical protein KBS42_03915 [Bacteroidales bacterium]|nr:hypothetical protein [Candidatus Colicola coprequi]